jgi:hypothetical protein
LGFTLHGVEVFNGADEELAEFMRRGSRLATDAGYPFIAAGGFEQRLEAVGFFLLLELQVTNDPYSSGSLGLHFAPGSRQDRAVGIRR